MACGMTMTERRLIRVGGSVCVSLPYEWVRALKVSSGISHRIIGVEWDSASPEIKLRALALEELSRESLRKETTHTVVHGFGVGDGAQVVSDSQVSSGGSQ